MKPYPRFIEVAWATYETFRRLGFKPDEVYVSTARTLTQQGSAWAFFVVLKLRSEEEDDSEWFKVDVGIVEPGSEEENSRLWESWCSDLNGGVIPDTSLSAIYRREIPSPETIASLVAALKHRGFPVRVLDS